ncbi:REST corepressor isoform X1 [Drosophila pseudoobscura]|uniref:REST corepressor isoform X1 n=1 Tax=Drosophila pseudoobscura pseudoobscura TaxID=46245 RepID=A0A6I8W4H3_DROPS|nr:REST corepressor isoform X1 [Drosophila pseudoobscura]
MVLAERNTTDVVRNGRRSRGPSPNTNTTGGVASNASLVVGGGGNPTNPTSNEKASTTVPGAGTPESSDDDNSTKRNGKSKTKQSEYEEKIRVGRDYQAVCPPLVAEVERRPEQMNERALLVWSPTKEIPDLKLEEYISVAKEKYGYNGEQALGMLFWHKHDLERAVMDLANFTPFPDEWTIEDKVLFEQAFQFHGKSFHRIRQMLPDKSIASLVKYYYSWKKTRHRSSAMDRQEKAIKVSVKDGSENGSEVGSNEESDNDDKTGHNNNGTANTNTNTNNNNNSNSTSSSCISHNNNCDNNNGGSNSSNNSNDVDADQLYIYTTSALGDDMLGYGLPAEGAINGIGSNNGNGEAGTDDSSTRRVVVGGFCKTCNVVCHVLYGSPMGRMCKSCHTHWRRTGNLRPISGPESNVPRRSTHNSAATAAADRSKRKPPKGMYINHDDITALATCKNRSVYLAERGRKNSALMAEIQKNRQHMELLEKECDAINVEDVVSKPAAAISEAPTAQPRTSARWTSDEIQVALLVLRGHGRNYPMIAKYVPTKTEAHVRSFYLNNRRRYNLDQIVKEYEAGKSEESGAEEHIEQVEDGSAPAASAGDSAARANSGSVSKPFGDASNNGSNPDQESQAKKEEKPELVTASAKSDSSDTPVVTAITIPAATASSDSSLVAGAAGDKSATITILDESDTATNWSNDVATSSTNTGVGASSSSLSSASTPPAPISVDRKEPDSEELATPNHSSSDAVAAGANAAVSTGVANAKRDISALTSAEQPPAKKVALCANVESLGK